MSTATDSFRDQLYNVDTSGRRVGFYPKKPKGKLYKSRTIVSIVLLIIFFGTPWLKVNGDPLFLFNVLERKFILFGQTFWPQDLYLMVLAIISLFVFVILFTVVFGRLWCGWACPQTIFLEMVYRKIEYWIEGDASAQKRLAAAPMSGQKFFKLSLKHTIFAFIAFLVSNTVLAYIVGMDNVLLYVKNGPANHLVTFFLVLGNTGVFYFVFAWFREQACIMVCPYGRLQGVLLDSNSVVISYDYVRGEPRGKINKKSDMENQKGDCVDCKLCVAVCPTGIDIRNGTQLECVNCTACIDACDEVMEKVGRPKKLIRFASHNQIAEGVKWAMTGRAKAYVAVLAVLVGAMSFMLFSRADLQTTFLRAPGQVFSETAAGNYTNLYTVKIVNKSREPKVLSFKLANPEGGKLNLVGSETLEIPGGEVADATFIVELEPKRIEGMSFKVEVELWEGEKKLRTEKVSFLGPVL